MMYNKTFFVYILTNATRTVLYTGLINDLKARIMEHYLKVNPDCFTAKYNVHHLLYYEEHCYVLNAIERENEIKTWSRKRKMELINTKNPGLKFLNADLFGSWPPKNKQLLRKWK